MDLVIQKSNESYYGTHKIHLTDCPEIKDLPKENAFTFWDTENLYPKYSEAVKSAQKARPSSNIISCPKCLEVSLNANNIG
ncbi:hypothetical protein [Lactococcus garvieae]|uniref:Uncharacterized protein n=1 Tax=Lactococcus garvieae TaxID=1363 RepID=A0AAX3NDR4_9LACT|nr:hypothetical protein [Lactococcus garvieae]NHI70456.1 hypothetical protein [Lactococcus garvieae]NHJ06336.1 hypothetical protein [Lactococcus garvieae]WEA14840.1 hypothetical protein PWF74_04855 [Lactococcus garvieae]